MTFCICSTQWANAKEALNIVVLPIEVAGSRCCAQARHGGSWPYVFVHLFATVVALVNRRGGSRPYVFVHLFPLVVMWKLLTVPLRKDPVPFDAVPISLAELQLERSDRSADFLAAARLVAAAA